MKVKFDEDRSEFLWFAEPLCGDGGGAGGFNVCWNRWKDAWTRKLWGIKLPRADTVAQISSGQESGKFIPTQWCQPQLMLEILDAFFYVWI